VLGLKLQVVLEVRLHHAARGVHDHRERVFLTKKRGESLDHVLMKLLSWLLFYHPDLRIEVSADQHYKPDLVRFDERGAPLQWVDCGQTALKKLDRIASKNRKTLIDIVKPTERELRLFKDAADSKVSRPERVRYFAFRDGFLNELAELIHTRHEVEATVRGDAEAIELVVDGVAVSSPVIRL
jgi:uncharacterized protein YaeQ